MKKILLPIVLGGLIIALSGCTLFAKKAKEKDMAAPDEKGNYHYENSDLGFKVSLSKEFQYYQVQRKNKEEFVDLEFFLPTSDIKYPQEIQSYGKPMIIRVYTKEGWDKGAKDNFDKSFKKLSETTTKTYLIKFWKEYPDDWKKRWNKSVEEGILKSFEAN